MKQVLILFLFLLFSISSNAQIDSSTRKKVSIGFKTTSATVVNSGVGKTITHKFAVVVSGSLPVDVKYTIEPLVKNIEIEGSLSGIHVFKKK